MKIKEEEIEQLRIPKYVPQEIQIIIGIMPFGLFALWAIIKLFTK